MTPTRAAYLAANFEVISSINTSDNPLIGSGFDATVWRIKADSELAGANNENAGKTYVSMCGTEPDAGGADLIEDINLANAGLPYYQLVSMGNWRLRETAVAGAPLKQISLRKARLQHDLCPAQRNRQSTQQRNESQRTKRSPWTAQSATQAP